MHVKPYLTYLQEPFTDVTGRYLSTGDIVIYSSSKEFMLVKITKVYVNRRFEVVKFKVQYPYLHTVKSRILRVGEQEVMLVNRAHLATWCGGQQKRDKTFISKLLSI